MSFFIQKQHTLHFFTHVYTWFFHRHGRIDYYNAHTGLVLYEERIMQDLRQTNNKEEEASMYI